MRKLLLLGVVLFAPSVWAQETYSISANAAQVTDLTSEVRVSNEQTCSRFNLAFTCTQAQACTAAAAPGGSACTAAQARGANARVFPQTQAGREEFVTFVIAAPEFTSRKSGVISWDQQTFCTTWRAGTQTQKDAMCTAGGLSAGCTLCP